ncbi:hypothetical protein [Pseudomonas palleroniana]
MLPDRQRVALEQRVSTNEQIAYSYWNSEFFFMNIKSDFPGNP